MIVSYMTVLEVLLKSLPLSLAALLMLKALRRQSAATRSKLVTCCFVVIALFPVCALVSPKFSLAPRFVALESSAGMSQTGPLASASIKSTKSSEAPGINWGMIAFIVWSGGAMCCQLSLAKDLFAARKRIKALERSSTRVGVILYADREDWGPCVWGWWRPTVVIPSSMGSLDEPRRSALIAHELAHVERGDWLKKICFRAIRGFYWFNPLVWQLEKRAVLESEMACDDSVLRGAYDPTTYAEALIAVARSRRQYCQMAPGASGSFLSQRLLSLFNGQVDRTQTNSGLCIAAAILVGVLGIILAPWTLQLSPHVPWALPFGGYKVGPNMRTDQDWVRVEGGSYGPPSLSVGWAGHGFYTVRCVTRLGTVFACGKNIEVHENGVRVLSNALPSGVAPVRKVPGMLHIGHSGADIVGVIN